MPRDQKIYSFILFILSSRCLADGALPLQKYLEDVQKQNPSIQGATLGSRGVELRSQEGSLVFAPVLSAQAQYALDKKQSPFFTYQALETSAYSLGISQNFRSGTQAKFTYGLGSINYQGFKPKYYEGRPQFELVQPLLKNSFGSEYRATEELQRAAALATHHTQNFMIKGQIAEAEATYWRLALARENVKVQKDALARSEKIFEWSNRRAKLQLGDTSDLLQAQAALEIRRLQLDSATHEAISAARTFNTARGIESSQVNEVLDNIDVNRLLSATLPVQPGMRDDVKAALQQQSAAIASSKLGVQKNTPTLDLFGTYALNSRQGTTGQAMGKSWSLNYPSSVIGVRFSSSLDISGAGNTKDGYRLEETAADLNYTKKLLDEKQEWNELRDRFDQGKSQLKLTQMIEATQEKKLKRERDRLSSGRSTTYQVLVFEQDFAAAQLARIQSEASLFQIYSKVRLYQGSPQ